MDTWGQRANNGANPHISLHLGGGMSPKAWPYARQLREDCDAQPAQHQQANRQRAQRRQAPRKQSKGAPAPGGETGAALLATAPPGQVGSLG